MLWSRIAGHWWLNLAPLTESTGRGGGRGRIGSGKWGGEFGGELGTVSERWLVPGETGAAGEESGASASVVSGVVSGVAGAAGLAHGSMQSESAWTEVGGRGGRETESASQMSASLGEEGAALASDGGVEGEVDECGEGALQDGGGVGDETKEGVGVEMGETEKAWREVALGVVDAGPECGRRSESGVESVCFPRRDLKKGEKDDRDHEPEKGSPARLASTCL